MSSTIKTNDDFITASRQYIQRMLSDPSIVGSKALLLDPVTVRIVSMVYSQTQILGHEVYLVEQLGKAKHAESMPHLKAVVFLRPTESNIAQLCRELANPLYREYHIFFSNTLPSQMLTRLGRADTKEVVRQVHEYYADYLAVNPDLFHLGQPRALAFTAPGVKASVFQDVPLSGDGEHTVAQLQERNVQGVLAALLSLKMRPSVIRYSGSSAVAKNVATAVSTAIDSSDLFDFRQSGATSLGTSSTAGTAKSGPLLLVLDRMDDPVTPLLTQWTYQAMVHELLGINDNRVLLKPASSTGTKPASKPKAATVVSEEVVLSSSQDPFFQAHKSANFGDLGDAIKKLLTDYQRTSKKNDNIRTIEDMQAFVERYPAFRSSALNVSKHVTLVSELARLTDVCQLMALSQLEQEIVSSNGSSGEHNTHKADLADKIRSSTISPADKLRLALLFLIRYEQFYVSPVGTAVGPEGLKKLDYREISGWLERGANASVTDLQRLDVSLQRTRERPVVAAFGHGGRAPTLFSQGGVLATLSKHMLSSIQGVENVYTQHQPLLTRLLGQLSRDLPRGRTREATAAALPFVPLAGTTGISTQQNFAQLQAAAQSAAEACRPTDIIVFIVGGATYEEALAVAEFNRGGSEATTTTTVGETKETAAAGVGAGTAGIRAYLGGTCIHNSSSFLREIGQN